VRSLQVSGVCRFSSVVLTLRSGGTIMRNLHRVEGCRVLVCSAFGPELMCEATDVGYIQ
jgi:hypothetical protein